MATKELLKFGDPVQNERPCRRVAVSTQIQVLGHPQVPEQCPEGVRYAPVALADLVAQGSKARTCRLVVRSRRQRRRRREHARGRCRCRRSLREVKVDRRSVRRSRTGATEESDNDEGPYPQIPHPQNIPFSRYFGNPDRYSSLIAVSSVRKGVTWEVPGGNRGAVRPHDAQLTCSLLRHPAPMMTQTGFRISSQASAATSRAPPFETPPCTTSPPHPSPADHRDVPRSTRVNRRRGAGRPGPAPRR